MAPRRSRSELGARRWLRSEFYDTAIQLEELAFTDGALSKKHKELTALFPPPLIAYH